MSCIVILALLGGITAGVAALLGFWPLLLLAGLFLGMAILEIDEIR